MNEQGLKSLYVYIPCHSDINLAIAQARSLRKQNIDRLFKLFIEISVNNFKLDSDTQKDAYSVVDSLITHDELFLYDANIALGFYRSALVGPDYFWILSANDDVSHDSLRNLNDLIVLNPDVDLFTTNSLNEIKSFQMTDILNANYFGLCTGLISANIFKYEKFKNDLNASLFTCWTGWQHLAVIQSAINRYSFLNVLTFPSQNFYSQKEETIEKNILKYSHGLYGMVALIFLSSKPTDRKRFIRRYLLLNFYKLYRKEKNFISMKPIVDEDDYLMWNRDIAIALIKSSSLLNNFIFIFFSRIDFVKFKNFSIAHKFKLFLDRLYLKKSKELTKYLREPK